LIESILQILEKESRPYEDIEPLIESVQNFNAFYVSMCKLMIQADDHEYNDKFKLRFDTFKKASLILNKI